jgi:hypothetical protein
MLISFMSFKSHSLSIWKSFGRNLEITRKSFRKSLGRQMKLSGMQFNNFIWNPFGKKQVRFLPSSGLQKSMSSLGYPNHGIQITDT